MLKVVFNSTLRWLKVMGRVLLSRPNTADRAEEDDTLIGDVVSLTYTLTRTREHAVPGEECYRVGRIRGGVLVVTKENAAFWAKNKRVI